MDPLLADFVALDKCVERFESARSQNPDADLAAFLPAPTHPSFLDVLSELIRIDLEMGWRAGQPVPLGRYRERFPELFLDGASRAAVAYEEYRQRCQAGEQPEPEEYRDRFGVATDSWPRPTPRRPPAEQVRFPQPGEEFAGFRLLTELGRGAVGRVFLAAQGELADRPVVVKIAPDLFEEPRTLAQLQHTHIVPIYSCHRQPPLQAVCMPYLGKTTLADLLRRIQASPLLPTSAREVLLWLSRTGNSERGTRSDDLGSALRAPISTFEEGRSYVELVLWLAARLAEGLEHAHQRGILHLDLKPANVLLTNDGLPLLLDFNLAQDVKCRSSATVIGGTLPYMAPELLAAFAGQERTLDGRADVYSLGVVLYELLTGQSPFAVQSGPLERILERARARSLPPLATSSQITPAVRAIVLRCLHPQPEKRYQSARQLAEDLDCQLNHQPLRHQPEPSPGERLRKWLRRHPRLTSSASVAILAGILLLGLGSILVIRGQRLQRLEAAGALTQFRQEVRWAQFDLLNGRTSDPVALERGVKRAQQALGRYRILTDPDWRQRPAVQVLNPADRERLCEEAGDLLLLWSRLNARLAEQERPDSERQTLLRSALQLNQLAERAYLPGQAPCRADDEPEASATRSSCAPSLTLPARLLARQLRLQRQRPGVPGRSPSRSVPA